VLTAVVRRDALLDLGGFDEELAALEDWDLWLRLAREGLRFGYSTQVLEIYRDLANAMHRDLDRMDASARKLLAKFFQRPGLPARLRRMESECRARLSMNLAWEAIVSGDRVRAAAYVKSARRSWPLVVFTRQAVGVKARASLGPFVAPVRSLRRQFARYDARRHMRG
jgi:hypothetical protein